MAAGKGPKDWIDYYVILGLYDPVAEFGLGPDATQVGIKRAWKSEQLKWYPDRYQAGSEDHRKATARSKLINEAYEVLSDPVAKERYDRKWRAYHKEKRQKKKTPPEPEQPEEKRAPPEIVMDWDPPEAASANYFYDLGPDSKRQAFLWIRPKFPGAGAFKVRVTGSLPEWLEVTPSSFTPPAKLRVVADANKVEMGAKNEWHDVFELGFVLDE